jgi:RNA polymerase sigma factor (TIGR02999 family)
MLAEAKLAWEKPGQTLQATALVHEAYLRLIDVEKAQQWDSRGHFFSAAAEAMRRILIDRARRQSRLKRGGNLQRRDFSTVQLATETLPEELLAIDEALEQLRREHPDKADLVTLRFFGGLAMSEAAAILGISASTADRHWSYARAWLLRRLRNAGSPEDV